MNNDLQGNDCTPIQGAIPALTRRIENNHEEQQGGRWPGRDLNQQPNKYNPVIIPLEITKAVI
jgi:hypothetical protein